MQLKMEAISLPEIVYGERTAPAPSTLIEIDSSGMEVIRSLAVNWDDGVRFRDWLVAVVVPDSPYASSRAETWVSFREEMEQEGIPQRGPHTLEEYRENRWAEEQARRRPRWLH